VAQPHLQLLLQPHLQLHDVPFLFSERRKEFCSFRYELELLLILEVVPEN
jgi:hypothetical protein